MVGIVPIVTIVNGTVNQRAVLALLKRVRSNKKNPIGSRMKKVAESNLYPTKLL
ncbi:MAG: hypothetical protein ACJATE_000961 [Bacteroidia bacterium]|jgi:hypothetical protein